MPDTPAIAVHGLRKMYGDKAAVDGVDLVVPRGCFFGFLGPNGAGKSTTIRMLTGLIPPSSGLIELLGMRLPEQELEIKKRIGLVPDESLLFDRLTGAEFLEFVGRMYGLLRATAIERAQSLLDLFELRERRKLIAEYSKGMRKRLAMAASLIHHPDLFLMDEPFEGVDAVGARLMKDITGRSGAPWGHHLPDFARAGSRREAVRPGSHYRQRQDRARRLHGRVAWRHGIAGRCLRAPGRRGT